MPANSPYPGESQKQFAMRQGGAPNDQQPTRRLTNTFTRLPDQPPMQDEGGSDDAGIRQAIAQRFPGVQPDKLDEIYQAWEEHSHWAQREGQEPDLDQFFQQYEADAQGFGGREPVNQELDPAYLKIIKEGQGQEQMQEMPSEAMQQQAPRPSRRLERKKTFHFDKPLKGY